MRLTITGKENIEPFVAIFQLLKNWTTTLVMDFDSSRLHIQTMDKSHVCISDIVIQSDWFTSYECEETNKIAIVTTQLATLVSHASKYEQLEMVFNSESGDTDKLYLNFLNSGDSFNHFYELQLVEIEENELQIPKIDYDGEFTIASKKFHELLTELQCVGEELTIKCFETYVGLCSKGDDGTLTINVKVDDLDEYGYGDDLEVHIGLNHLAKMCMSTKLSQTLTIGLSVEYPLLVTYALSEQDGSYVRFYIAPKVSD